MKVLRVRDVAQLLGTTPENIRKMVARGQLPARKLGRRLIFIEDEFKQFIEELPKRGKAVR